jgi:ATP-dependent DNA helicase RecG
MSADTWLDQPLRRSVGTTAATLEKLGLTTARDLLWYFPRRYLPLGELTPLSELKQGEHVTFVGQVVKASLFTARTGTKLYKVTIDDGATRHEVTFFNPGKLIYKLHEGTRALFNCEVGAFKGKPQLTHPDFFPIETAEEAAEFAASPYPVYPLGKGVKNYTVLNAVRVLLDVLPDMPDPIPHEIRSRHRLLGIVPALRAIHRPRENSDWREAQRRFRFEEAFVLQVALAQRRAADRLVTATPRRAVAGGLLEAFDARLPFELTQGQRRVAEEIARRAGRGAP